MKTYIIGHKKPDLDSVIAALSFAEYLSLNGVANPTPAIVDDLNPETQFVLNKFQITTPQKISAVDITPEDRVVLVDHNEADQRLSDLNPDQIIGIFDHHKVNVNFNTPIEICIMPFGSSNTVAWQLFSEIKHQIPVPLASLMLSAILSDTVGLKSSTTTDKDRQAVANLSQISGITDTDGLTLEIFKAKSNISSLTSEQIVTNDYKVFDFGGKKVFIGQTETVEQEALLNTKLTDLQKAMQVTKANEKVDYLFLCITDILKVNTKIILLADGEKQIAEKAFGQISQNGVLDIGPALSRKKDIAPKIEIALTN